MSSNLSNTERANIVTGSAGRPMLRMWWTFYSDTQVSKTTACQSNMLTFSQVPQFKGNNTENRAGRYNYIHNFHSFESWPWFRLGTSLVSIDKTIQTDPLSSPMRVISHPGDQTRRFTGVKTEIDVHQFHILQIYRPNKRGGGSKMPSLVWLGTQHWVYNYSCGSLVQRGCCRPNYHSTGSLMIIYGGW